MSLSPSSSPSPSPISTLLCRLSFSGFGFESDASLDGSVFVTLFKLNSSGIEGQRERERGGLWVSRGCLECLLYARGSYIISLDQFITVMGDSLES